MQLVQTNATQVLTVAEIELAQHMAGVQEMLIVLPISQSQSLLLTKSNARLTKLIMQLVQTNATQVPTVVGIELAQHMAGVKEMLIAQLVTLPQILHRNGAT